MDSATGSMDNQKGHFKNFALRNELNLYDLMFFIFPLTALKFSTISFFIASVSSVCKESLSFLFT